MGVPGTSRNWWAKKFQTLSLANRLKSVLIKLLVVDSLTLTLLKREDVNKGHQALSSGKLGADDSIL